MPVLNINYGKQAKIFLKNFGAVIQVTVGINQDFSETIKQANKKLPSAIEAVALIDTGAFNSCIDNNFAKKLNLPILRKEKMGTISNPNYQANVYPCATISLHDFHDKSKPVFTFQPNFLLGAELGSDDLHVLLGRDFLENGILIFNGPNGTISFSQ